jgi:hypothetical protein
LIGDEMEPSDDPFWELRFWRRVLGFGIALTVPVLIVAILLGESMRLALIPFVAVLFGAIRVNNFDCPNCGRPFIGGWFFKYYYTNKCVHCGHSEHTP